MEHKFKNGDIVKIKSEWANSENEKQILFVILKDSLRDDGKCKISPITGDASKLSIVPTELVSIEMLNSIGFNITDYIKTDKRIFR